MPCYTDPPTALESAAVALRELVKEVRGKKFNHKDPDGIYDTSDLQRNTKILCSWCKTNTAQVPNMSLELQIWWRDHQESDAKHERQEIEKKRREGLKLKALSKLTREEQRLLGL